jgi:hypothetical protein
MNTDFENALHSIVQVFANARPVIWARQNRATPTYPFYTLQTVSTEAISPVSEDYTTDIQAGDVVTLGSIEHVETVVQLTCFSSEVYGDTNALALLTNCRGFLKGESAQALFDGADMALVSAGQVQDLSQILETEFYSQAVVELRLRVRKEFTETATYIGQADIETDIEDEVQEITVVLP